MRPHVEILTGSAADIEISKRKGELDALRDRVIHALGAGAAGIQISESMTIMVHVLGGLIAAGSTSESDLLDNLSKIIEGLRTVTTNFYVEQRETINKIQKGIKP